jgi:hypothetical protein
MTAKSITPSLIWRAWKVSAMHVARALSASVMVQVSPLARMAPRALRALPRCAMARGAYWYPCGLVREQYDAPRESNAWRRWGDCANVMTISYNPLSFGGRLWCSN